MKKNIATTLILAGTIATLGAITAIGPAAAAAPSPNLQTTISDIPHAKKNNATPIRKTANVANTLDSKMTVKNSTTQTITVWMGAGTASDIPTQMTILAPGQSTYMQGWSYLPHGKDVQATIDYSASPLGSSDRVKVSAENPSAGWPSLQVEGYDQNNLSAGESATRTVRNHTLDLHRNTDLTDAKDFIVTVNS